MSETMTRYSKAPEKMKKYEDQQITSPINRTRSLTYSLESKFRQPSISTFIANSATTVHHGFRKQAAPQRHEARQWTSTGYFVFSYLSDSDSVTDQGLSYFCLSSH